MILHKLAYLSKKRINLSSKSPRRIELLKNIGLVFDQNTYDHIENADRSNPKKYVMDNAKDKLFNDHSYDLNIASDTIVVHNSKILEKPKSKEDAFLTLTSLSGKKHIVYTGVCLRLKTEDIIFYDETIVEMYPITTKEIEKYIETKEPMDKAGSYGIQGRGSTFIKSITGCYYNVMGFPISLFCKQLNESMEKGLL